MEHRRETKEIKGKSYTAGVLDARAACDLVQMLMGAVAGFAMSGARAEAQIGAALRQVSVSEVMDVVGSQVRCEGKILTSNVWPEHFRGDIGALWTVCAFALEVNLTGFFGDFKPLIEHYSAVISAALEDKKDQSQATNHQ